MTATADELQGFVADAQGLVENRRQLAIIAQDASPVYLDCSTGKVLVKTSFLDERQKRRRLRLAAQKDTLFDKAPRHGGPGRQLSWSIGREGRRRPGQLAAWAPRAKGAPYPLAGPRTQARRCRRSCRWRSRATPWAPAGGRRTGGRPQSTPAPRPFAPSALSWHMRAFLSIWVTCKLRSHIASMRYIDRDAAEAAERLFRRYVGHHILNIRTRRREAILHEL